VAAAGSASSAARRQEAAASEAETGTEHYGVVVAPIRLDQLNLIVTNIDASRAFYARLGVSFDDGGDPVWADQHVSAMHNDDLPLDVDLDSTSFAQQWNAGWSGGPGVVLGFKVDSRDEVDSLVETLAAAGVPVQQPPYDAFWGARYAVVSDPDGNAVGIMSPIDPDRRSPI
jgi:catechol 2,3-dioxygenase-like lactoylglutathione lyase family enzyme